MGDGGASGPSGGRVVDPGGKPAEVDRRSRQQVLQLCPGQTEKAAAAQAYRPPRENVPSTPARRRSSEANAGWLSPAHATTSASCSSRERGVSRRCSERAQRGFRVAGLAVPRRKADAHNSAPEVVIRTPTLAAVPGRADGGPPIPVEAESIDGERAVGARLPLVVL